MEAGEERERGEERENMRRGRVVGSCGTGTSVDRAPACLMSLRSVFAFFYSERSASTGLTRIARRAGSQPARSAIERMSPTTAQNTTGSVALTS